MGESEDRRLAFYAAALVVALEKEPKLRKATRRAILELRLEAVRDPLFQTLRLDGDPLCPDCGGVGRPISWCAIHKNHDYSVTYMCLGGHHFWVQDPLGRTKALRAGRSFEVMHS